MNRPNVLIDLLDKDSQNITLKDIFNLLEIDTHNVISRTEFNRIIFPFVINKEEGLELNIRESINIEHFCDVLNQFIQNYFQIQSTEDIFNELDMNHDGFISSNELKALFTKHFAEKIAFYISKEFCLIDKQEFEDLLQYITH